jgi:hypothetical protein
MWSQLSREKFPKNVGGKIRENEIVCHRFESFLENDRKFIIIIKSDCILKKLSIFSNTHIGNAY